MREKLPDPNIDTARARLSTRSVVRHGLLAFVDQAIVSVAAFLPMLFVGKVSREELGVFSLAISSYWLVAGLGNALVWTPYTSRAARMSDQTRIRFRGDSAGLNLALSLGLAAVSAGIALSAQWVFPDEKWIGLFFLTFGLLVVSLNCREYVRRVYLADLRPDKLLALDIPISVAGILIIGMAFCFGMLNAQVAMFVTALVAVPGLATSYQHLVAGRTSLRKIGRLLVSNWKFSKWLLIVAVAWLASDGFIRWMLVGLKGKEAVGEFAGAFLIVSLVNPIIIAFTSFARSIASHKLAFGSSLDLTTDVFFALRWLVPVTSLGFLALCLVGNPLLNYLFGYEYGNQPLVVLLAAAVCLEAITVPLEATFVALEKGQSLTLIAVSRFVFSAGIACWTVPQYGVMGVAIAMLGRSILVLIAYSGVFFKMHRTLVAENCPQESEATPVGQPEEDLCATGSPQ